VVRWSVAPEVVESDMPNSDTLTPGAIALACAWQFAFNLKSSEKGTVGYIADWRGLGGLALDSDIVLWSPTPGKASSLPKSLQASSGGGTVADQVRCVAVIERLDFGGEASDPMRIVAYISKDNQVKLRYKLVQPLPSTKVKLDYAIMGYDDDSKAWYTAIAIDSPPSKAQINTGNGELQLFVQFEPTSISETLDIKLYRLEFEIIPGDQSTRLKIATGPTHRYIQDWKGEE
jgi:hypothetical protein